MLLTFYISAHDMPNELKSVYSIYGDSYVIHVSAVRMIDAEHSACLSNSW